LQIESVNTLRTRSRAGDLSEDGDLDFISNRKAETRLALTTPTGQDGKGQKASQADAS
jgi:hypothetical protein